MSDLNVIQAKLAGIPDADARMILDQCGQSALYNATRAVEEHGFSAESVTEFAMIEGADALRYLVQACVHTKGAGRLPADVRDYLARNPRVQRAFQDFLEREIIPRARGAVEAAEKTLWRKVCDCWTRLTNWVRAHTGH